ncbi:MAG TPA: ankyrin repeat domain-containing protein, partial [Burkholderiaceae bacterium]
PAADARAPSAHADAAPGVAVDGAGRAPAQPAPALVASLKKGADAAAKPAADGALRRAADAGDVQAIRRLLAQPGAQVDAVDAEGRSALLHAVLARQPEAVRALLAAGADPARADRAGLTPRAAASQSGDAALEGAFTGLR